MHNDPAIPKRGYRSKTMTLDTLTPTAIRLLFAACCGAPDSPMTQDQRADLLRRLITHTWYPTPQDTPAPFGLIEAWYADVERRRRQTT